METGDIQIKNAIVHIMDTSLGMAVYSDVELDYGSDFSDFMKNHIARVYNSDDLKQCRFEEGSEVAELIQEVIEEKRDFISMSREMSGKLYEIMQANPDIPSADLLIAYFEIGTNPNLAILKMNYKESYTHSTAAGENGNVNTIIRYRSTLPEARRNLRKLRLSICRISESVCLRRNTRSMGRRRITSPEDICNVPRRCHRKQNWRS